MQRHLNEWNDEETKRYHQYQLQHPYRSTVMFADFIKPLMKDTETVADLGAGAGGPTQYLAKTFPDAFFTGYDIHPQAPDIGHADMFDLSPNLIFDAVVSLQTLSWLPEYETPLHEICTKIKPQWMAFSSLFYEGEISCKIEVTEYRRPRESYYNIYSIPKMTEFLRACGYIPKQMKRFDIDIRMPKPANKDIMKSYTYEGLIFSGPLYLPWWFLAYEKS